MSGVTLPPSKAKSLRESEALARKRMRKGTRSCLQCRSRKVRCTYPANSRICHGCLTHGRDCTEQTYNEVKNGGLDKRVGLKERVRELEALVEQLVEKGGADAREIEQRLRKSKDSDAASSGGFLSPPDSNADKDGSPVEQSADGDVKAEDASDSYDDYDDDLDHPTGENADFQKAPLMSLLNNSLLEATKDETTYPIRPAPSRPLSNAKTVRQAKLVADLRALLPSRPAISVILAQVKPFMLSYNELVFHAKVSGPDEVESHFEKLIASDRPIDLLKAIIFLGAILQQNETEAFASAPDMLSGATILEVIHRYSDAVEQHLCASNSLIGSLDGLEVAVILSKLQLNDARPRKSWLLTQRALSYCRLLGFHRSSSWNTPHDPVIGRRRRHVWALLYLGDRAGSLLLGLPYSIVSHHAEREFDILLSGAWETRDPTIPRIFPAWLKLAMIAGRIVDRNQDPALDFGAAYGETMKIDAELHTLQHSLPKRWRALSEEAIDVSELNELPLQDIIEASMVLTFSHECRIALHMPFMMKNAREGKTAGQYEYSRMMAASSARANIRCHLRIRAVPDLTAMVCQMVDFQVFNSTVLLVLDIMSRSQEKGGNFWRSQDEQTAADMALIKEAYKLMRSISQRCFARDNVPAQAVKVLETLGYLLKGCAVPGLDGQSRSIVIPYFGAITIKPSKALEEHVRSLPPERRECAAIMAEIAPGLKTAIPSHEPISRQSTTASVQSGNMPTPDSIDFFGTSEANSYQNPYAANDFTFNPFSAPQESVNFAPPPVTDTSAAAQGWDTAPPQYHGADGPQGYTPLGAADPALDATMWDDGQWQQMLLDPSLDLDNANWGFFPVGNTA